MMNYRKMIVKLLDASMDSKFVHQNYCSKTRDEGGL